MLDVDSPPASGSLNDAHSPAHDLIQLSGAVVVANHGSRVPIARSAQATALCCGTCWPSSTRQTARAYQLRIGVGRHLIFFFLIGQQRKARRKRPALNSTRRPERTRGAPTARSTEI